MQLSKRRYLLSGVSVAIPANQSETMAINIPNGLGMSVDIIGMRIRFKPGLEDCLISLATPATKKEPILSGNCTLAGIGQQNNTPDYGFFPFNGDRPKINRAEKLELKLQTFNQAVTPRDINLLLICEESENIEKK